MKSLDPRWAFLAVPVIVTFTLFYLQLNQELFSQPANLQQVIKVAKESTFEIKCNGDWVGAGWAVEISGKSHVVTAHHVVEDCLEGEFISGRNETTPIFSLELVRADGSFWDGGSKDLALLKSSKHLPALKTQRNSPEVGQWVLAVGFPLEEWSGPLANFSEGRITGIDGLEHIVTSAAINGGNSGGPLINSRGEVVGTVYAYDFPGEFENLGYAQPMWEHCGVLPSC